MIGWKQMKRRMFIPWLIAAATQAAPPSSPYRQRPQMKESTRMKLFIFAKFHAREGKEGELVSTITTVSAATRAEPDCLGHQVFQSTKDARLFFVHSQWTNGAAFERHIGLPHTLRFVDNVGRLIDHELHIARTRLVDAP